jgi:hypothetical protein
MATSTGKSPENQDLPDCRVPAWMGSVKNLAQIKLEVLKVDQHQLDVLGGLQNLLHLELRIDKVPDEILIFSGSKGFQSLKYLCMSFSICSEGTLRRVVMFEAGSLSRIKHLDLLPRAWMCFEYDLLSERQSLSLLPGFKLSTMFYNMGIESLSSLTIYNFSRQWRQRLATRKLSENFLVARNVTLSVRMH